MRERLRRARVDCRRSPCRRCRLSATVTVARAVRVRPPACSVSCAVRHRRAGCAENSAVVVVRDDEAQRLRRLSFAGPLLIAVAQPGDASARQRPRCTVWSAPFVKLGASLTGVTVIVKVCVGARVGPPFRRCRGSER